MNVKNDGKVKTEFVSGFESGSLFDLCPSAPSHSQAQAADTRHS